MRAYKAKDDPAFIDYMVERGFKRESLLPVADHSRGIVQLLAAHAKPIPVLPNAKLTFASSARNFPASN